MTNLSQMIEEFQKLNLEDKKEKLMTILQGLTEKHQVFKSLVEEIPTNPRVDDNFLIGIYKDLMGYANILEKFDAQEAQRHLHALQSKVELLHQKEEQERLQEHPNETLEQDLQNI